MMTGSRKYPTDRDKGQSCTTLPPAMIPGFKRIAVPVGGLGKQKESKSAWDSPVTEISITVPFVTLSKRRNRLTS